MKLLKLFTLFTFALLIFSCNEDEALVETPAESQIPESLDLAITSNIQAVTNYSDEPNELDWWVPYAPFGCEGVSFRIDWQYQSANGAWIGVHATHTQFDFEEPEFNSFEEMFLARVGMVETLSGQNIDEENLVIKVISVHLMVSEEDGEGISHFADLATVEEFVDYYEDCDLDNADLWYTGNPADDVPTPGANYNWYSNFSSINDCEDVASSVTYFLQFQKADGTWVNDSDFYFTAVTHYINDATTPDITSFDDVIAIGAAEIEEQLNTFPVQGIEIDFENPVVSIYKMRVSGVNNGEVTGLVELKTIEEMEAFTSNCSIDYDSVKWIHQAYVGEYIPEEVNFPEPCVEFLFPFSLNVVTLSNQEDVYQVEVNNYEELEEIFASGEIIPLSLVYPLQVLVNDVEVTINNDEELEAALLTDCDEDE